METISRPHPFCPLNHQPQTDSSIPSVIPSLILNPYLLIKFISNYSSASSKCLPQALLLSIPSLAYQIVGAGQLKKHPTGRTLLLQIVGIPLWLNPRQRNIGLALSTISRTKCKNSEGKLSSWRISWRY